MDKRAILLIVEGEKTEYKFFDHMFKLYGLDYEIVPFSTNIYSLYMKMKEYDFNCELKDVLKTINRGRYDELLDRKYAYTYLIFDCEVHHDLFHIGSERFNSDKKNRVLENINRLKELALYFNNETDPSIGRLYVNFPMMESYKDCDSFDDLSYLDRKVHINDITSYKKIVGTRKLCNLKRVDEYSKEDLGNLTYLNLVKIEKIISNDLLSYDNYLNVIDNTLLLEKQEDLVESSEELYVCNQSLLLLLDYFGNKHGFYDYIINLL